MTKLQRRIVVETEAGGSVPALPVFLVRQDGSFATPGNVPRFESKGYRQIILPDPDLPDAVVMIGDVPEDAVLANILVEGAGVRYRDDGVDPTKNVGMPIAAGGALRYDSIMTDLRFVGQARGAIIDVTFYGLDSDA